MNPKVVGSIFEIGKGLIDRFFPDPVKKAEAHLKLVEMKQNGELAELAADTELAKGQQAINLKEAEHPSLFVSGWRPAIGWVCAIALGVYFIPRFLVGMFMWSRLAWTAIQQCTLNACALPAMPEMGIADILGLVATLLGASWIRMREKEKSVARIR